MVNDGSTDATSTIARRGLDNAKIETHLLENFPNRGKGAAVRRGLLAAQRPIGLFFDADLSTPLEEIPKVIEPIANNDVDLAFGSRALDRSLIGHHQPWRREQGGRVFNLLVRLATGLPFWDTQCGFKAFRLDVCRPILEAARIEGFAFDVELLYTSRIAPACVCAKFRCAGIMPKEAKSISFAIACGCCVKCWPYEKTPTRCHPERSEGPHG